MSRRYDLSAHTFIWTTSKLNDRFEFYDFLATKCAFEVGIETARVVNERAVISIDLFAFLRNPKRDAIRRRRV